GWTEKTQTKRAARADASGPESRDGASTGRQPDSATTMVRSFLLRVQSTPAAWRNRSSDPGFLVCAFVTPTARHPSPLGLSRTLRDTAGEQEQRDSLARQMGRGFNDLRRSRGRPGGDRSWAVGRLPGSGQTWPPV